MLIDRWDLDRAFENDAFENELNAIIEEIAKNLQQPDVCPSFGMIKLITK